MRESQALEYMHACQFNRFNRKKLKKTPKLTNELIDQLKGIILNTP
jgi:hypothetical protein